MYPFRTYVRIIQRNNIVLLIVACLGVGTIYASPNESKWNIRRSELQVRIATLFQGRDYKGVYALLKSATAEAKEAHDAIFQAKCLNNLGIAACKLGDNVLGIESFRSSIRIYQEVGNDTLVAQSKLNLGILYKDFAAYDEAVTHITNAASIFERLNLRREEASALNTLGNIMRERGHFSRSLTYLQKSLEIRKQIGNHTGIGESLNNIGITLMSHGDFDKAINVFKQSITYKLQNGELASLAPTYSSLGEAYMQKADMDSAMIAFQQALHIRRNGQDLKGMISSQLKLANLYLELKNYTQSRTMLDSVNMGLKNYEAKDLYMEGKRISSRLYAAIGAYDLAYQDQLAYALTKDSVLSQEREKIMTNAEVQYEVAQKEAENDRLVLESTIHEQRAFSFAMAFCVMSALLGTSVLAILTIRKKKRLIEVLIQNERHNSRNYLSKITQLITQQTHEVREEVSRSQWQAFETRIRAMQLLSSTLMEDAKASQVEITQYIVRIWDNLALLFGFKGDVLVLEANPVYEDTDTAHTIGLIANELLCNALKYALPNHPDPKIKLSISSDKQGKNQLRIEDNGLEVNLFQPSKGGGQGLKIVHDWVKWIKGELILESKAPGTVATVIWETKKRSGIWKSRPRF